MTLLDKSEDLTYRSPGDTLRGDLDHVIVSNDLAIQEYTSDDTTNSPFDVYVTGWNELTGTARTRWIEQVSDHCALQVDVVT